MQYLLSNKPAQAGFFIWHLALSPSENSRLVPN
jgi:hypothetical protein